ncbi:hypothetical protein Tco_1482169 [Tanacetum coccineum]
MVPNSIFFDHIDRYTQRDIDHAAGGVLMELSVEESWETIEDCAKCDKQWQNLTSTISDQSIANLKAQLGGNEMVRVKIPRQVPIFDEPDPQPQPLPSCPSLDVSLGDERGLKPPIKPHSPDSFRMKAIDNFTIHTPPSSHVASFHLKDVYCYYHPCIDDLKKHYGFKAGLLRSLTKNFSNLEVIEDDFLGEGLSLPIKTKELEKGARIDYSCLGIFGLRRLDCEGSNVSYDLEEPRCSWFKGDMAYPFSWIRRIDLSRNMAYP